MILLPDYSTAQATGCAVCALGQDLKGRPVWSCTLWFSGAICHAVLTAEQCPYLSDLLADLNRRPAVWQVMQSPKNATA